MTETERKRRIDEIKQMVHRKSEFDLKPYNDSNLRKSTNCYSYAIGSLSKCLELNRLGAISGKKPVEEPFTSEKEILDLLYQDLKVLDLKIEKSSEEEEILDNQYKIALFLKIYADEKIHDYHFLRFDPGIGWTEKFRNQYPRKIYGNFKNIYNTWPWNFVGIFKITK